MNQRILGVGQVRVRPTSQRPTGARSVYVGERARSRGNVAGDVVAAQGGRPAGSAATQCVCVGIRVPGAGRVEGTQAQELARYGRLCPRVRETLGVPPSPTVQSLVHRLSSQHRLLWVTPASGWLHPEEKMRIPSKRLARTVALGVAVMVAGALDGKVVASAEEPVAARHVLLLSVDGLPLSVKLG